MKFFNTDLIFTPEVSILYKKERRGGDRGREFWNTFEERIQENLENL